MAHLGWIAGCQRFDDRRRAGFKGANRACSVRNYNLSDICHCSVYDKLKFKGMSMNETSSTSRDWLEAELEDTLDGLYENEFSEPMLTE